jgi:hypothetical protein
MGGWRNLHNKELNIVLFIKHYTDQIKGDGLGRACSMHRKDEKCIQNFIQGT